MNEEILKMEHITKIYGNGVVANKDIMLSVRKGEIHALMGENGAGKSTLMKILFGLEPKDSGEIYFEGKKVEGSSSDIIAAGIGMVHQHFMLVDSFTVYENVILGMEPKKGLFTDSKSAIQLVDETAKKYNLNIDPMAKVGDISVGLKQKVEILKVLVRGARLLILDEPTAVLTPQETQELFEQLLLLKESGHTIIFISHKIKEVKQICDRLTVLRRGRTIGTMEVKDASEEEISNFMVGRDVILNVSKEPAQMGDTVLKVRHLSLKSKEKKQLLQDVSFDVKKGQILGIAGVEGNGQNELVEAIFGMQENAVGEVFFHGENILKHSIAQIRREGISYIPEDRMTTGVASEMPIWGNLISDRVDSPELKTKGLLSQEKIRKLSRGLVEDFTVLCRNDEQEVGMLSGGNMQKVVVAREFSANPELLIANQPTRGIDVGAIEFIWKKVVELRDEGRAIILVSADLNEIFELSDSILVMCDGEVAGYFPDSKSLDETELGLYMLGIKKQKGGEAIEAG